MPLLGAAADHLGGNSQIESYKRCLVNLMNFTDSPNPPYTKNTEFTQEMLLHITDADVYAWLAHKAYGVRDPTENDRGVVLLVDQRYATHRYRTMLPVEWEPIKVRDQEQFAEDLQRFWKR